MHVVWSMTNPYRVKRGLLPIVANRVGSHRGEEVPVLDDLAKGAPQVVGGSGPPHRADLPLADGVAAALERGRPGLGDRLGEDRPPHAEMDELPEHEWIRALTDDRGHDPRRGEGGVDGPPRMGALRVEHPLETIQRTGERRPVDVQVLDGDDLVLPCLHRRHHVHEVVIEPEELARQALRVVDGDAQIDGRPAVAKSGDPGLEQVEKRRVDHAHPQRPTQTLATRPHACRQRPGLAEDGGGVSGDLVSHLGEASPPAVRLEQRCPDDVLQPRQSLREGGLRYTQQVGGLAERSRTGDGIDVRELAKVDGLEIKHPDILSNHFIHLI
jgi:hypothetical protein